MKIAFDAKRVYQNETGLGNYSRSLISSLADFYPQHSYYLCAPKITGSFDASAFHDIKNITPNGFTAVNLKSLWRSNLIKRDLLTQKIDLYHGLSNEIPLGVGKTNIKSVVTIHDLIFERYPKQYNLIDSIIYRSKFKYACNHADKIIAISQQTKEDIINFYKVPEDKIAVCYQSCDPAFMRKVSEEDLLRVKNKYCLPGQFFLYVGSIIERKNLLNICKALYLLQPELDIPLVVIGSGSKYKQRVRRYLADNHLENQVIFLADKSFAVPHQNPGAEQSVKSIPSFSDFPAIYQQAICLVYPSIFEGFGIPVLEALWSGLPVITSKLSCMPETAGDAAIYVDPYSVDELAKAMRQVAVNVPLQYEMQQKGWRQAQNFLPEKCATAVMDVYLQL